MKTVNVTTKEQLDDLYQHSALTWEGLCSDEDNLNAVIQWLTFQEAIIEGVEPTFHIISGELMNSVYGLTGDNAYNDDLTIVAVTDIARVRIVVSRFSVGGRWFDDIVDNNAHREGMDI